MLKPGYYRHFKGGLYQLVGIARHSETLEQMVVYRAPGEEGGLWARPLVMWEEQVLHEGQLQPRFKWLGEEPPQT
ncbi:MAG: DUF1653 domain-containing protein [Clostridiales bacterium]|nr:DUF1653 domain-containing protein [Clostridiales bacterium]